MRGFAKNYITVACMVFSANLRAIYTFLAAYGAHLANTPTDPGAAELTTAATVPSADLSEDLPPPDQLAP